MFERLAIDRGAILYDAQSRRHARRQLFDPAHWRARDALHELSGGRGSIQFIDADEDAAGCCVVTCVAVWRRASRVTDTSGSARTARARSTELRLLAALHARGPAGAASRSPAAT